MKLRTSFSKLTPFKKDLTRFAPVWALYLIGMLLFVSSLSGYGYSDHFACRQLPEMIKSFGIINMIYGAVCAVMLFSDLFNTRMCYALHALPQRREIWLLSHAAAGFCFSFVPNVLVSLLLMVRLEGYWFLGLYWLLAVTLQYLFFFGLGVLSTLLTGNRFAALLVCAGFNFVSMLIYAAINTLYLPLLVGVSVSMAGFSRFSPVANLFNFEFFKFTSIQIPLPPEESKVITPGKPAVTETRVFYEFQNLSDGWGYLAILAIVGVVLLAISLWLYRKRHLETAGDFLAFPLLKMPTCVIITLCVCLCTSLLGTAVSGSLLIWLPVGLTVGFFGSLMLLERRLKVFRKKTFLGFAVISVCMILSLVATEHDWFGVESWTPKADQVQSVTIGNYRTDNLLSGKLYQSNRIVVTLTEQEDIERIVAAHDDILDRLGQPFHGSHRVTIQYKMKSGRTVVRSYNAHADGKNYEIFSHYFYQPDQILGYGNMDWEEYVASVQTIYCNGYPLPESLRKPMLEALRLDCENNAVSSSDKGDGKYCVDLDMMLPNGGSAWRSLFLQSNAKKTLAILQSPEAVLLFDDWEQYLAGIRRLELDGEPLQLDDQQLRSLMEAIRQDIDSGSITGAWGSEKGRELLIAFTDHLGNSNSLALHFQQENCKHTGAWLAEYYAQFDEAA